MTGFARTIVLIGSRSAVWELKSVNGRNLDMRFRLPAGYERLEPHFRAILQSQLKRGTIAISLTFTEQPQAQIPVINKAALAAMLDLRADMIARNVPLAPSTLEGLLSIKGVIGDDQRLAGEAGEHDDKVLAAFSDAALELGAARRSEGTAISAIIDRQLGQIEALAKAAKADPSLQTEFIAARLGAQLEALMQSDTALDVQRLHMEAALLATKADIREETDRLLMHTANARQLLKTGDGAGRKLDFLAQEFNREANTLCSKANAATLTSIGLELKVTIDQFREQIQNLE
jgi:uncharacterized protein (TIGR00255 family)